MINDASLTQTEKEWLQQSTYAEAFYTDAFPRSFVLGLAREFEVIDLETIDQLWQCLGMAGNQFELFRDLTENNVTPTQIRSELRRLSQATAKLSNLLDFEPTPIRGRSLQSLLWRAEQHLSLGSVDDASTLRQLNAVIDLPDTKDGRPQSLVPSLDLVRSQIRYLIELLKTAETMITPSAKGRKTDQGLRIFIDRVARFWSRDLGRSVKVDPNEPQNYTLVEQFMERCVSQLDPNSVHKIKTYLRDFRTDENSVRK